MWESPTSINWSNGFAEFFAYINSITLGWASRMILIGIFIIVITGYYKARDDFEGAFAVAGVATFVVALAGFLLSPPFVDWYTFSITIGVMFIGVAVVLITKDKGTA